MRRLLTLAAISVILSVVPANAQRGGGGHGGGGGGSHSGGGFSGGHSSFSGGHSSFSGGGGFSGSHVSAPRSGAYAPRPGVYAGARSRSSYASRFGSSSRIANRSRSGGTHWSIRTAPYGYGFGRGYGYGYGYPYSGYYSPYWAWYWGDDSGSSDSDQIQQQQLADQSNEDNLDYQQELQQQDEEAYANRPPQRGNPVNQQAARTEPATVLVYRDEHQREIQNYAIVDGILWNFTPSRTERIPLAVLDIPATIKANDDRGNDFRLPSSGEGQ